MKWCSLISILEESKLRDAQGIKANGKKAADELRKTWEGVNEVFKIDRQLE